MNEEDFKSLFNAVFESISLIDRNGVILAANETFAKSLGMNVGSCVGQSIYSLLPEDLGASRKKHIETVIATSEPHVFEDIRQDCWLQHSITPILASDGSVDRLAIYTMDITRRKQAQTRRQVSTDLFALINTQTDFREMIKSVVEYLRSWTGCEAVGIRIHEGDDYPYYETSGFPEQFVQLENRLCQYDANNEAIRDSDGSVILECMCGNVLSGRIDSSKPFFTSHGSFWSNCTSDLLASTTDDDRQTRTRNRCNGEGYESVALIPLRSGENTAGLMQFNDKRKGLFTPELIGLLERIGENIASVIMEKQAREAQRLSDERYRTVVASTNDGIILQDRSGLILTFNKAAERIFGLPAEIALKQTSTSRDWKIYREDGTEWLGSEHPSMHTLATAEPCQNALMKVVRSEGDFSWVNVSTTPVFTLGDIQPSAVVITITDITEQKLAEEQLHESQDNYRSLAEDMPVYISSFLPDGTLTYVNSSLAAVTGTPAKELIGLCFYNMCDPEETVVIKERLQSLTPDNPAETHEQTNVYADGSIHYMLWTNRAFFDDSGRTIRFQAIGQDITEHRKTEQALKISEEKFSKAFHLSPDAVNINRLEDGCYVDINQGFTDTMGYTREEIIGRSSLPGDVGLWVNIEDRNRLIEGLMNTSEVVGLEAQFRKKDGSIITGLMSARIIEIDGEQCIISISRDITHRKRMEEELREAAMRQQAAVQAGNIGLWDWDLVTNKVTYSPEWKRQIGYEPDEIGDDLEEWQSRVHPDDIGPALSLVNTCIAEARHYYHTEFRFRHKDESYRWILAQASVIMDDTGHPIRVVGAHVDITERRKVENALQESESRLSDIIFSMADWVWEVDKNGVYTYSSQKGIDLFGRTSDDIIGMTPFSFMPPDEIKKIAPIFSELLANQAPIRDLENWNITKDGERICLLTNGVPILDEDGKLVGYRGVDKDITQRKLAEETLASYQAELKAIYDHAPVMMCVVDEDRHILYANQPFADFTMASENDLINGVACGVFGCINAMDDPKGCGFGKDCQNCALRLAIDDTIKTGTAHHDIEQQATWVCAGDRRDITLLGFTTLIQSAGQKRGLLCIQDITERKRAEKALQESKDHYRSLVENTPDVIKRFDLHYRHVFVNPAIRNSTGLAPQDFIGKSHREMGLPEDLCLYLEDILEFVIQTGVIYETEFSMDSINGEAVYDWRVIPESGLGGEIESVLSISRDITDRRKAEQDYRTLFHEMLDGFAVHEIICDESGNPVDYRFLAVNPAFEHLTGLNSQEIIGRTVMEVMPDTEKYWIDVYGKVVLTGEPIFFENYSSELNKHFEVTAFRSAPNQFACIFVDITERKHVEQEKRQFYRDTIKSVTQGKLDLVSSDDVKEYLDPSRFISHVDSASDGAVARAKTMDYCRSNGLHDNGLGLFESAVGEAITNAIKHANGCSIFAGVNGNTVTVAVTDTGQGISTILLPGATLRKGYSSKISMGMGYTIMMEATDNIMLCTGSEGTTVVLSVNTSSTMPALSLDDFPDTWNEI